MFIALCLFSYVTYFILLWFLVAVRSVFFTRLEAVCGGRAQGGLLCVRTVLFTVLCKQQEQVPIEGVEMRLFVLL